MRRDGRHERRRRPPQTGSHQRRINVARRTDPSSQWGWADGKRACQHAASAACAGEAAAFNNVSAAFQHIHADNSQVHRHTHVSHRRSCPFSQTSVAPLAQLVKPVTPPPPSSWPNASPGRAAQCLAQVRGKCNIPTSLVTIAASDCVDVGLPPMTSAKVLLPSPTS